MDRVAAALAAATLTYTDEVDLHADMARVMAAAGIRFRREVTLTYPAPATARGRIDFLTDNGAGIEVKVAGSLAAATRQLLRYAHSPDVRALLLVTTVAAHRGIPQVLAGVPVTLHSLTGQGLR